MSLSKDVLADVIRPFFDTKTMPKGGVSETVLQWVTQYSEYAKSAIAGGVIPGALVPVGIAGRFSNALDSSLRSMWMSVPWAGPGLVGTTLLVPPLAPVLEGISVTLLRSRDPQQALSLISDALHTYTLGITVTVVSAAGVSVVAPLT